MNLNLTNKEKFLNLLLVAGVVTVLGQIFYGYWWLGPILFPIGLVVFRERKKQIMKTKKLSMEKQFKEMLIYLSDALNTGYSVENAIKESYKDMLNIYDSQTAICKEQKIMISQINLNIPIERVFMEFAERSKISDAFTFAQIFLIAKRKGGNIREIIKHVTDTIVLKETVKDDIEVAINEKQLEQKVMTGIPLFLIVFISFSAPGFLDVMYETIAGRIVMTICLGLYVVAYIWSLRIAEVEV